MKEHCGFCGLRGPMEYCGLCYLMLSDFIVSGI